MFRRGLFFSVVLGAALALPYVSSQWHHVSQVFSSDSTQASAAANANPGGGDHGMPLPAAAMGAILPGAPGADATSVVDMGEAFRFDVTAAWVLGRWPRVTAGLPDKDLQGYRVPLVTGTREDDLAGSLTYYFTKNQHCRRITFQGTTGDARRFVALLSSRFGLVRRITDDPSLYDYQNRWNGRAISELHVRPARVVRASQPEARFEVLAALNDPDAS